MAVMSTQKPFVVDIVVHSDTLCPWCYIEKRSLEAAMEKFKTKHPDTRFEVTWKPFYLNPMLKIRCDKRSLYDEWSGGADKFDEHLVRINAAGSKYKIPFSITGRTGSSRNAHRLIALTRDRAGAAAQGRVVEALFKGHFEDGRDIADNEWLISIAGKAAGIPAEEVAADLEDEATGKVVDQQAEDATNKMGVEAVPCVTVQSRYKVGGYQEEAVFENLFEKIRSGQGR